MDETKEYAPRPRIERDRRCQDCGGSEAVRFYHDAECSGVHSCYLCDACATREAAR